MINFASTENVMELSDAFKRPNRAGSTAAGDHERDDCRC
jgi:hypothetical protein